MPTYTNKHGLPDPLFQLLGRESYSRGDSRRSATQLIDSPRLVALKEKHLATADHVEVDVSERIWALFGTAVHKLIEDGLPHSDWSIREERIFTHVEGWKISGAVDLQWQKTGGDPNIVRLVDWKVCSIFAVRDGHKPEWERQLNVLAYLVEKETDREVSGLQIGALIRDWSRAEAKRDPTYPQTPFHMVDIPLWSYEEREDYVVERVRLHQDSEVAVSMGDEPPHCTPDEMWEKPTAYAVMRKGNKRASKILETQDEAATYIAQQKTPGDYEIDIRLGERTRCLNFCDAAAFCSLARFATAELDDGF